MSETTITYQIDDSSSSASNNASNEEEKDGEESDEDENGQKQDNLPKIKINMHNIPPAVCDDDDDELAGLGVTVYNQYQYEEGVMNQIDEALLKETSGSRSKSKKSTTDLIQQTDFTTVDASKIDRRVIEQRKRSRSPVSSEDEWTPKECIDLVSDSEEEDEVQEIDDERDSDFVPHEYERLTQSKANKIIKTSIKKSIKSIPKKKPKLALEYSEGEEVEEEEEEEEDASGKIVVKRLKKIQDDGNEVFYRKRLKQYHQQLLFENQEKGIDGEEIDEFDIVDEEHDFKVPRKIWSKLYPYQQACVKWLWQLHQGCVGGIIGDEMGLGKTIQVIAFLAGLKCSRVDNFRETFKSLGPTIIVCPATVMHQWVAEIHKWFPPLRVAILHSSGSYSGTKGTLIRLINKARGIIVTTYSCITDYQDYLMPLEWHYIILDEGHKIRNPDAMVTLAVKRFRTPHRIILSGSPIQNNLRELWSLFDFIYPGKLGTLPVFTEQFSIPITQGGYSNASEVQVKIGFRCATVLRDTIKPYLLRRMKDDVKETINLPSKNEQVLFCRLTDEQRSLYQAYIDTPEIKDIIKGSNLMFVGLINLRKICNHPDLFPGLTSTGAKNNKDQKDTLIDRTKDEFYGYYKKSGKMHVVDALLKLWHKQEHKVLLFSQGTLMLDILEKYLRSKDYTYLRLDGSTAIGQRQNLISTFNSNKDIFIFLLTTRVGGIGVNLTSASRVLIYDPDWNPSTDMQARERAWRIGQERQVTIYRLLTAGTIEEKIYQRQVFKQYLTNKVLKDPKQRRFFKTKDLYELFTLASDEGKTESSAIFAGTGSEISVPDKKVQKEDRKKENSDDFKTDKKTSASTKDVGKIELPPEKIEELREKAKRLSQMLANKFNGTGTNATSNGQSNLSIGSCSSSNGHLNKPSTSGASSMKNDKSSKTKNSSKSHSDVKKGTKFEGKRIKYLVKKNSLANVIGEDPDGKLNEKQDEYVLKKLFKKSSTAIHSAIQHDVIEAAANPDFTLVEAEADKVAEEAIEALKKSRSNCFSATSGIPNWTGAQGSMKKTTNTSKPAFGKNNNTSDTNNHKSSSNSLLQSIKMRNRVHANEAVDPITGASLNTDHGELLGDLRSFIAYQSSSGNGSATTDEILNKFRHRIPNHQTPVFKALLWKICDLHKKSDGSRIWRLKGEFS